MADGYRQQRGRPGALDQIHPPDWIEVLPTQPVGQVLRGITVVAPGTYEWRTPIESILDVDIVALPKPRPDAVLHYREFVGPETTAGTMVEGNATKSGAAITPLTNPDGIRVHVKVAGARSFTGGSPGKFRALYWLYWEVPEPEPTPVPADVPVSLLLLDGDRPTGVDHVPTLLLDA